MKKILVLALVAAALLCSSFAESKLHHVEVTYYVQSGETLWSVASRYMEQQNKCTDVRELIDDIRRKNGMMGNDLQSKWQPGQEIIIPLEVRDEKNA